MEGIEQKEDADVLIKRAKRHVAHLGRMRRDDTVRESNESELHHKFMKFRYLVEFFSESLGMKVGVGVEDFLKIMQNDSVPAKVKEFLRDLAKDLLTLMVKNNLWYQATLLANFLGDYEEIDSYLDKYGAGYWTENGEFYQVSRDLVKRALEKGGDRLVNRVMEQDALFDVHESFNRKSDYMEVSVRKGAVYEIASEMRSNLIKYMEKYGLEEKLLISNYHVNAAMEISRMDYDYIVGIYKGCTSLTTPLEIIGDNVRYIGYSRNRAPEREPEWLPVGRVSELPEKMERVLVCEDDVVTGGTLRRVQKLIDGMQPQSVDLRLHGVEYEKGRDKARRMGYYRDVSNLDVGFERFVENLREFNEILKRRLEE